MIRPTHRVVYSGSSLVCPSQRMRGGDDFNARSRASPGSDDSDEDTSAVSLQQRRKIARSTLGESWRLYLMQIPSQSKCIAETTNE
jgi:hypothetical protein